MPVRFWISPASAAEPAPDITATSANTLKIDAPATTQRFYGILVLN